MQAKEYALYKGEELIAMGTKREIAEQLGVSPSTVGYYGTPVYVAEPARTEGDWLSYEIQGYRILRQYGR